jgi:hypothetical protein
VVQPFTDGCMMIADPRQISGRFNKLIKDGTAGVLLTERRSRRRHFL